MLLGFKTFRAAPLGRSRAMIFKALAEQLNRTRRSAAANALAVAMGAA
jgi:hypothetical protein